MTEFAVGERRRNSLGDELTITEVCEEWGVKFVRYEFPDDVNHFKFMRNVTQTTKWEKVSDAPREDS